jgi:hypothetical protein
VRHQSAVVVLYRTLELFFEQSFLIAVKETIFLSVSCLFFTRPTDWRKCGETKLRKKVSELTEIEISEIVKLNTQ